MPTYKIQLPDGRTLTTQAADEAGAIAGAQAWVKSNPKGSATYQARRQADAASPSLSGGVTQALTTMNRAIPGAGELTAGLGAAGSAIGNAFAGKPANLSGEFAKQRDTQQADIDQFKTDHPVLSDLATGAGYAVQAAPALASGGATVAPESIAGAGMTARAGRVAQTVTRNAMTGAKYAAVNGAAQPGKFGQRVRNAMAAVPIGAAAGVALPAAAGAVAAGGRAAMRIAAPVASVATEGAGAMSRAVTGKTVADQAAEVAPKAQASADQAALAELEAKGVTAQQLRQASTDASGKPITTGEAIGPSGITTGSRLVRRAGDTPDMADAVMAQRAADRGNRILGDLQTTTGIDPAAAKGGVDDLVAAGRANAKPLYDLALGDPAPVMNSQLADLAQRPAIKSAVKASIESAKNAGRDPNALGLAHIDNAPAAGSSGDVPTQGPATTYAAPTGQTWQDVKQKLSDMIEWDPAKVSRMTPAERTQNVDLQSGYKDLATALHDPETGVPGLAEADSAAGDYLQHKQALGDFSGQLFNTRVTPAQFDAQIQAAPDAVLPTAKAAVVSDLYNGVMNKTVKPGMFTVPAVRAKLASLFGDDAATEIAKRMQTEAKMQAAESRMRPNLNSPTSDVLGDQGDGGAAAVGNAVAGIATGHPIMGAVLGGVRGAIRDSVGAAMTPATQASRNAMGKLIFADPNDVADMLDARQGLPSGQPAPTIVPAAQAVVAAQAGQDQR